MMNITKLSSFDVQLIQQKLNRNEENFDLIDATVKEVMIDVKQHGDAALKKYTEKFDGVKITSLKVQPEEIVAAFQTLDDEFLNVLQEAKQNITDFHEKQLEKSWFNDKNDGIILGQKVTPLERVGVYIPGGKATYPSTVLMTVIPAWWLG